MNASHETHTVREFVGLAFAQAGMEIRWEGTGADEKGIDAQTGKTIVRINPAFYRPAEVDLLIGNPGRAERQLGWRREVSFAELVERMVKHDLELVEKEIRTA